MFVMYVVSVFLLLALTDARNIPEYIHICKRSDPNVAKCVRESIEVLRPKLKLGIPELDVPGLEPLFIKEVSIFRDDNRNLKAYLRNIEVRGASDFEITKLKLNVEKSTFRVGVKLPLLRLQGDYEIDARVLVPIKGNGQFYANATNCEGQGVLRGEVREENGVRHLIFTAFDFAIHIGDFKLDLQNLFNGDPVLSQAAGAILNDNRPELIQAATPFIEMKTSEILLKIANQITNNIDYDEAFPE